jgi:hypothetical protein
MHYRTLHALVFFDVLYRPLLSTYSAGYAVNTLNTQLKLQSCQSTWMVARFVPHIDPEIANYPKHGGNSVSACNVELMA